VQFQVIARLSTMLNLLITTLAYQRTRALDASRNSINNLKINMKVKQELRNYRIEVPGD